MGKKKTGESHRKQIGKTKKKGARGYRVMNGQRVPDE